MGVQMPRARVGPQDRRRQFFFLVGRAIVVALLAMAFAAAAAAQGTFKIEPAALPPAALPHQVEIKLHADGTRLLRVVNGIDKPLAEIWWVNKLPLHASRKTEIEGAVYGELAPGRLLAVVHVLAPIEDVRNQRLLPGFYTARYAQLDPAQFNSAQFKSLAVNGNDAHDRDEKDRDDNERENKDRDDKDRHNNDGDDDAVIPVNYRDYVVLARLDSDTQAGAQLSLAKMFALSRQVLSGKEPVLLALPPLNPAYRAFPYAVSDDVGNCAVQFKLPAAPASGKTRDLPISILLVNPPNVSKDD